MPNNVVALSQKTMEAELASARSTLIAMSKGKYLLNCYKVQSQHPWTCDRSFEGANLNIREIWNWLCPMSKAGTGGGGVCLT